MSERDETFTEIHKALDQIKGNIPSTGVVVFWLAAVPAFAAIVGLSIAIWVTA